MAGHLDGLSSSIEASKAGSNEDSSSKTTGAADHVHDTRAGKVNVATVEKESAAARKASSSRGRKVREPALARPGPVHDDGVDPHGDEPGVAEVGVEVEALSNSAGRDGGGGGSKSPLVEEVSPAAITRVVRRSDRRASEAVLVLGKAVEGISNEGVGVGALAISNSEATI